MTTSCAHEAGTKRDKQAHESRFIGIEALTRTESRVLALVENGLSNQEIATTLSITVGTVKCNLHRVHEKLQLTSRLEAVTKLREHRDVSANPKDGAARPAEALIENRL